MIYFLLGFFMAVLIWPVCSSLEQLLEQLFEYWKTSLVAKMYSVQKIIEQNETSPEPEKHYGFSQFPYPEPIDPDDEK